MRLAEMIYTEEDMQELRNENKNLKLVISQMENTCKDYLNDRDTLREENKKLQEKVNTYSEEYGKLREENKNLKDKIDRLESDLLIYKNQYGVLTD